MLKQKHVTIGIILPYVWTIVFLLLIIISYVSNKISSIIAAENLIMLSFFFSPGIYITGITVSLITLFKAGLSKNVLFALVLNSFLLIVWFIFRKSFYIELNMIS
ncbi:MAG: hypothetical protein JXA96_01450 [Sedimentisphaerales bacterium]|nr:hypothetical protein [Sedimentisphaerales bacterium]